MPLTLDALLAHMEQVDAGRPALVDLLGRQLSAPALARAVRRTATGLQALAGQPGAGVAVLGLNNIETIQTILAAPLAGLLAVPLNLRWAPAEILHALHDAHVRIVALDDPFLPLLEPLRAQGPADMVFVHIGKGPTPAGMTPLADVLGAPIDLREDRDPASDAIALYTGGTTGKSKGVVHSHASLMSGAQVMAMANFPTGGKVYCGCFPYFHIAGIQPVLTRLLQSSTLVLVPMFRPDWLKVAVQQHGAQQLGLAPTMMQMLISSPDFKSEDFAGVERLMYGSSPMSAGLLGALRVAFPQADFTQAYGMTEAGIVVFLGPQFHTGPLARIDGAGQVGAPQVRARIESEDGEVLMPGQVGEIVIYGETLMSRYQNQPEATAAAMRRGGYRTGDVGEIDALGVLYVRDRLKDMIITGGENVYSAEVESALSTHPEVAQVAVVGVTDPQWGERVHAVVVPREACEPTLEALQAHVRERIAGYKIPRALTLVSSLPMSPMNKVLKHELRRQLAQA